MIYCGRQPQPSLEVWVGQVGVVGYEPFYVWVIVELRRSIPKGTVTVCPLRDKFREEGQMTDTSRTDTTKHEGNSR